MESLDVILNGCFLGVIDTPETISQDEVFKLSEKHLPRRTMTFKKIIYLPHRSITLIEKEKYE